MKKTPATKVELLLYAAYCAVLASLSRAFWPTKAGSAQLQVVLFVALSAWLALSSIRPLLAEKARSANVIIKAALFAPPVLLLCGFLFYSHVVGIGILLIRTWYGGILLIAIEAAVVAALWLACRGGRASLAVFRLVFLTILFCNSLMSVFLYMALWRPPTSEECERNTRNGYLSRITPQEYPGGMSYPNDIYFLDDLDLLAATFKMAGNLTIEQWNRADANRLVAIPASGDNASGVRVAPMTGPVLPEWMAWNAARKTLLVTVVGPDRQGVSEIDFSSPESPKLIRVVDVPFEPNGIAIGPDNKYFAVFGIEKKVAIIDADSFRITEKRKPSEIPGGINILDAYQPPGSRKIYLSMLGPSVIEYDLETAETRSARVAFGGGQLAADQKAGILYQTDILFGRLNIIDMKTMKLKRSIRLGYKPRAVDVDSERGLLMVGDWFNGRVHLFRISTMRELRDPIPISRYMRGFSYDKKRETLYCATICGVYRLDLDKIISVKNK